MGPMSEPMERWSQSVADPYNACDRADWLVLIAGSRGDVADRLIPALARCVPPVEPLAASAETAKVFRDLSVALATEARPSAELLEAVAREKQRLIDWNTGNQYAALRPPGAPPPEGIPSAPPAEVEALRRMANAVLRLQRAAERKLAGDDSWYFALPLVALHVVLEELGGGTPLYNHAETASEELSADARAAHRRVCERLRTELARRSN
jgi:hypothetical protein